MHVWLLIVRRGCMHVGGSCGEGDTCTHAGHPAQQQRAGCTVEREYKRLKAKRKQTGSSSSKPNSGAGEGSKTVRGALSAVADASAETFFPLFPIIFPHYFFKRPVK